MSEPTRPQPVQAAINKSTVILSCVITFLMTSIIFTIIGYFLSININMGARASVVQDIQLTSKSVAH